MKLWSSLLKILCLFDEFYIFPMQIFLQQHFTKLNQLWILHWNILTSGVMLQGVCSTRIAWKYVPWYSFICILCHSLLYQNIYNGWSWSCFVLFCFVAKESPQGSPSCGNASTWYIHSLQNYWDNLSSAKWIDVFVTSFVLIIFFSCIAFHLLYHAILLHNFVRFLQIWPRRDKGISCPVL